MHAEVGPRAPEGRTRSPVGTSCGKRRLMIFYTRSDLKSEVDKCEEKACLGTRKLDRCSTPLFYVLLRRRKCEHGENVLVFAQMEGWTNQQKEENAIPETEQWCRGRTFVPAAFGNPGCRCIFEGRVLKSEMGPGMAFEDVLLRFVVRCRCWHDFGRRFGRHVRLKLNVTARCAGAI